jgi:hypothetical protein
VFASGEADILILKQMGGVGLDVERVLGITDLSTIRALSATIQRWLRAATPWTSRDGTILKRVAFLIHPADLLADDIFRAIIAEGGGERRVTLESELLEEFVVPKKPKEEQPEFPVGDIDIAADDLAGNKTDKAGLDLARLWLAELPQVHGQVTPAELAAAFARAQRAQRPSDDASAEPRSINAEITAEQDACSALANPIALARLPGHYTQEQFRPVIRQVWREAYDSAGLGHLMRAGVKLRQITSLPDLKRLRSALEAMRS